MAEKTFKLPDLGEGLEDGEIVRWLVSEGDVVTLNQPLVEVDTAKALVEIPSPFAGTVSKLHAAEGDTVEVGAALITFEVEGAPEDASGKRRAVLVGYGVEEGSKPTRRRRLSGARGPGIQRGGKHAEEVEPVPAIQAPPQVRKLASDMGVDLSAVKGSGPDGRITREDVLKVAPSTQAQPSEERVAVKGVRKLVAEKMAASVAQIPHVTTYLSIDASETLRLRGELSESSGTKVTPLVIVSKALVEICRKHPKLNSSWDSEAGEIVIKRYHHLGVATDTDRGLLVPVVRDVDRLDLVALAEEMSAKIQAARAAKSSPEDLMGSTITISNVGSFGAEYGTPIINMPEAAILATGVIEDRVVVQGGGIIVRPMMTMSLSFDHRILDGAEAGRALKDLKALLEDPEALRAL